MDVLYWAVSVSGVEVVKKLLSVAPGRYEDAAHEAMRDLCRAREDAVGMRLKARQQLKEREMAGLPPYASLAMLRAEARTQEAAQAFLLEAARAVQTDADEAVRLYPPVPTPVQRVANVERAQMMIESPQRLALQRFLVAAQPVWLAQAQQHRRSGLIRWAVDVDPLSI